MRIYKCKNCTFTFSEADKAWDIAVAHRTCPKCTKKLVDFYVSESDSRLIRGNLNLDELYLPSNSLADKFLIIEIFFYVICLVLALVAIFVDKNATFFDGNSSGQMTAGAAIGLLILISYIRKRLKRNKTNSIPGG